MGNLGEKLMEDRMERCPFCGFEDGEVRPDDNRHYYVYCNCCECRGPSSPTKHRAVGAWNRWPDRTCPECGGTKKVTVANPGTWDREPYREEDCEECGGTGVQVLYGAK